MTTTGPGVRWLVPIVAFAVAAMLTAALRVERGDVRSVPATRHVPGAVAAARLSEVPSLPKPLATPRPPTRPSRVDTPAPAALPTATVAPSATAQPTPAPRSEVPAPQPTPAPTFDDSGSGPVFDDSGR